ncbi:tail fiber protein [Diaphorobacter sp.]|uniref:phage tail protein n=1 Tax=Diaphorobacter sp. TaxID=1934310 RepID=UPI00289F3590|nr:tail fiber protein [Diaphorobacter sp.]
MSEPYLGEIRLISYSWPPKGWAPCQGQTLSIASNQALFALLGTTYGGDGITTFKLPDLRGRVVRHASPAAPRGTMAGQEAVTLTSSQMPQHTHAVIAAAGNGNTSEFADAMVSDAAAAGTAANLYADGSGPPQGLAPACVSTQGGNQPHENCQPSLVLNYCIALAGIFPSRN